MSTNVFCGYVADRRLEPRAVVLRHGDRPLDDAEVLLRVRAVAHEARREVHAQPVVLRPVVDLGLDVDARDAGVQADPAHDLAVHRAPPTAPVRSSVSDAGSAYVMRDLQRPARRAVLDHATARAARRVASTNASSSGGQYVYSSPRSPPSTKRLSPRSVSPVALVLDRQRAVRRVRRHPEELVLDRPLAYRRVLLASASSPYSTRIRPVPEARHLRAPRTRTPPAPAGPSASGRRARSPAAASRCRPRRPACAGHFPSSTGRRTVQKSVRGPFSGLNTTTVSSPGRRRRVRDRSAATRRAAPPPICSQRWKRSPTSSYTASTEQPVTESCGPFCSSSFHAWCSSPLVEALPLVLRSSG